MFWVLTYSLNVKRPFFEQFKIVLPKVYACSAACFWAGVFLRSHFRIIYSYFNVSIFLWLKYICCLFASHVNGYVHWALECVIGSFSWPIQDCDAQNSCIFHGMHILPYSFHLWDFYGCFYGMARSYLYIKITFFCIKRRNLPFLLCSNPGFNSTS